MICDLSNTRAFQGPCSYCPTHQQCVEGLSTRLRNGWEIFVISFFSRSELYLCYHNISTKIHGCFDCAQCLFAILRSVILTCVHLALCRSLVMSRSTVLFDVSLSLFLSLFFSALSLSLPSPLSLSFSFSFSLSYVSLSVSLFSLSALSLSLSLSLSLKISSVGWLVASE